MHDELTAPAIMAPPDPARAVVVRPAAGSGGQTWVGSPSAVRAGGERGCEPGGGRALTRPRGGIGGLSLSGATAGTKHWRVELIEAAAPDDFDPAGSRVVLSGGAALAVKDPVIVDHGGLWHLWASVHPLDDPEQTDRMATDYATSADGLPRTWPGTAPQPRAGES